MNNSPTQDARRVAIARRAYWPWHRLVFQIVVWVTGVVMLLSRVINFPAIGVVSSWAWVPFAIGTACNLIWVYGWTIPEYYAHKRHGKTSGR